MTPAGVLRDPDDIGRAVAACRDLGWEPTVGPNAHQRYGYLGGTDQQRLDDLNAAIRDPAIDAIWCLRGGYGVTRILSDIDYDAFAAAPKVLIGYSDITALLNAVTRVTAVVTFHGPVARASLTAFSRAHLERVLGPGPPGLLDRSPNPIRTLAPGVAQGRLAGGNLSLLQCLVGTPYFPDLDGAILFLEDVAEDGYRVDRMLAHLRTIGAFDGLAGVMIGQFTGLDPTPQEGLSLDQIFDTYFGCLGIPVAAGFPIGHVDDQWTLPLGIRARLDADRGEVEFMEPAVR